MLTLFNRAELLVTCDMIRLARVREALAAGEVDLVVGTHALISSGIEFSRLGLVITDEQHRFGVGQRIALGQK